MLKLLIVARINELLFHYGPPSVGSTRWRPVYEFVVDEMLGGDYSTKNGKKLAKTLDLSTIDFSLLSDEKLVEFFELVQRRFYVSM